MLPCSQASRSCACAGSFGAWWDHGSCGNYRICVKCTLQARLIKRPGLTIHSSRTRFVASRLHPAPRAGRLNSGVRPHMKSRRSWKLSTGGSSLFLIFLVVPFFVIPILRLLVSTLYRFGLSRWLDCTALLACLIFLIGLLWFTSRPLVIKRLWRVPRSWYEAGFALTLLYLFYAVFIFVTGYTPSKYASHAVPRAASLLWLYRSIFPLSIGIVAYMLEKRRLLPLRPR